MTNLVKFTQIMLLVMSAYVYQQQPTESSDECSICRPGSKCEQPSETTEMGRRRR